MLYWTLQLNWLPRLDISECSKVVCWTFLKTIQNCLWSFLALLLAFEGLLWAVFLPQRTGFYILGISIVSARTCFIPKCFFFRVLRSHTNCSNKLISGRENALIFWNFTLGMVILITCLLTRVDMTRVFSKKWVFHFACLRKKRGDPPRGVPPCAENCVLPTPISHAPIPQRHTKLLPKGRKKEE